MHYSRTPFSKSSTFASSLDTTRLFKILREHFLISILKENYVIEILLEILTASFEYLDPLVSNKQVLRSLLFINKSKHALTSPKHDIFIQIL